MSATSNRLLSSLEPESCKGGPAPWKKETTEPLLPFIVGCPPLLLGGSVFGSGTYNNDTFLDSPEPYRGEKFKKIWNVSIISSTDMTKTIFGKWFDWHYNME